MAVNVLSGPQKDKVCVLVYVYTVYIERGKIDFSLLVQKRKMTYSNLKVTIWLSRYKRLKTFHCVSIT